MSIVDKVIAAVTPPESDEARAEARAKARAAAEPGDWLSMLLDHHEQIELAFEAVKKAKSSTSRQEELTQLAVLLTAHAVAEESVLYPALAHADEDGHAVMAYTEQAAAKLQMGLLECLPPMSQDFVDKLEHIRGAVAHHVYEEEGKWFLKLKAEGQDQDLLTDRYQEEFERYFESSPRSPRRTGATSKSRKSSDGLNR